MKQTFSIAEAEVLTAGAFALGRKIVLFPMSFLI